jgi:uncharacterized protein
MKKEFVACAILVLLFAAVVVVAYVQYTAPFPVVAVSQQQHVMRAIALDGSTIRVSIADNDATRELGLGGRAGLAPDEGMLFIFPQDGIYAFWMKDMHFSIDMIWLSAGGAVVYMAQNISPDTYPKDFGPATPARYVLELLAGYAKQHGVQIGDVAQI